jgi:hypothetical protein
MSSNRIENDDKSKDKIEESQEKIKNFKDYQMINVSVLGNLVTGLFVALIIIGIELINAVILIYFKDAGLFIYAADMCFLLPFFLVFWFSFLKIYKNTFKPVLVAGNIVATIDKKPEITNDGTGKVTKIVIKNCVQLDKFGNVVKEIGDGNFIIKEV